MDAKRRNRWKIGKHRKRAILRFCRNYPFWKKSLSSGKLAPDSPEYIAHARCIALVDSAARESDPYICKHLVRAVTEGKPYASFWGIPCGPDYYYDRRNKMIFLINQKLRELEEVEGSHEAIVSLVFPDTSGGDGVPQEAHQDKAHSGRAKEG